MTQIQELPLSIKQMLGNERGKRILLNLYWSLEDGLPPERACALIRAISSYTPTEASFDAALEGLRTQVYQKPGEFQFLGKPTDAPGLWMTVRSATDVLDSIREELGDVAFADRFDFTVGVPNAREQAYEALAENLNDTDRPIRFLINRVSKSAGVCRPNPGWFSRWCKFSEHCGAITIPSTNLATRVRDWLGLTHYGKAVPLFILRVRSERPVSEIDARRPTICDGFDNPVFKYPATAEYNADSCGSTADLELLSSWRGGPIDGGPEVVTPGAYFDTNTHECLFAGLAGEITYNYEKEEFHRHLLNEASSLESVAARVVDRLGLSA